MIFIEKSDSKFGGLKKDLNIIFSQEKLPAEFRGDTADIGLRPYTSEDGNPSDRNRPIGSWNQLYLWANVWDSSTKREGQDASATLQWNGSAPSTLIAADSAASMEMMDNRYTYMRHPILLRFYSFVGLLLTNHQNKPLNDLSDVDGGYHARAGGGFVDVNLAIIPVYVWWNPYNVDMNMQGGDGSPWGAYFGEYRFMPLLTSGNFDVCNIGKWEFYGINESWMKDLTRKYEHPMTPYNRNSQGVWKRFGMRQIADFGASFRTDTAISNASIKKGAIPVLKSGEIVIFSQPVASYEDIITIKRDNTDSYVDGLPFKEGWSANPSQVSPYAVEWKAGLLYKNLSGSGWENEPYSGLSNPIGTATASIDFAQSYEEIQGTYLDPEGDKTPENHILADRFTENHDAHSNKLGTFVMGAGLMNISGNTAPIQLQGSSTEEPKAFEKYMPAVLNLNWGVWQKPLVDKILIKAVYYNNPGNPGQENGQKFEEWLQGKEGEPDKDPEFVAYYGVSVKWGKPPVIGAYPEGKDYRAKTWQHSSPLFWGGQMPTASELGRLYSPYQFEVKNANSDFFPITISNILSNDGTRLSPFGGPGAEQVNKIVAAELPFQQPSSLAGFAGCRLTPGWYRSDSRAAIAKRFAYQSGVPGVGIGNAFADPMLPADKVFSHNEIMGDAALGDFWDHGLMINDALWDSWFASSLAARPSSLGGTGREELKTVLQQAFSTDASSNRASGIANRRFMPDLQGKPSEAVVEELARTDEGYKQASKYLTVAGGFNVNSTSQRAWEATLLGLKKRKILYSRNGRPSVLNNSQTSFSRFGVASSDKSHVDDYGSIGVTQGIPDGEAMAWSDLRTLSDTQIRSLARNMVKEVKKRGPFLNMSDFVNRRLQSGEMGVKGALQAAIDESSINSTFDELSDMVIAPKGGYPNQDAARGSVYTAAPGYLIQSDVLAVLGNILTTRDDTFTVRAYGELANREGVVLSRAWCEAVVQRGINYVDPVNSPETPARQVNMKSGALEDTELSAVNKAFGRKFNIVSFRWLSPEEV